MMLQSFFVILVLCGLVLPTLTRKDTEPDFRSSSKRVVTNRYYKPKSCLEFLKKSTPYRFHSDGYYLIHIGNTVLTVYCDMNSEAGSAWTLIMSYALENIKMSEFKRNPLQANAPVNELSPNWNAYRMAVTGMKYLASVSTHWRATCDFPNYGVDYTDYVRGKFSDFNITTYLGSGACKKVEYADIRGNRCAHCTAGWWQESGRRSPHMASSYSGCQFNGRAGAVAGEDNFNYYDDFNKRFRCTSNPKATTNWWFGGYL